MSINLPEDFSFKQLSDDFSKKIEEIKPHDKIQSVEEVCEGIFDQMSLDPGQKKRFYQEIKEIKKAPFQDQSTQSINKIKQIFQMSILSVERGDSGYASFSEKERVEDPISFFDVIYSLKKMIKEQKGDLNLSKSLAKFLRNYLKEERFLLSNKEKLALEDILKALEEKNVDPAELVEKACDTHLTEQYLTCQNAIEFINEEILSLSGNQGYSLGISQDDKISLHEVKMLQFYLREELKKICALKEKESKEAYNITLIPEKRNADLYHIKQSLLDQGSLSLKKGSQELKPVQLMIQGASYQVPDQYILDLYENQRSTNTIYHLKESAYTVKNKKGAENLVVGMHKFCDDLLSKDLPKPLKDLFKRYMLVFTTQHLQNSLILCSRSFASTLRSVLNLSEEIDPRLASKIVYKDNKKEIFFSKGSQENSVKISFSYRGALDFKLEQPSDSLLQDEFEKARKILDICEPLTLSCEASFEVRVNEKLKLLETYDYQNKQSIFIG